MLFCCFNFLKKIFRIYKHLGCPHGCADGQRGPPADFLRSQGQSLLMKLHRNNQKQFSLFLRDFVKNQTIGDVLEFFHAYLGFCVDPSSLLSPLSKLCFLFVLPCKISPELVSICYQSLESSNSGPESELFHF